MVIIKFFINKNEESVRLGKIPCCYQRLEVVGIKMSAYSKNDPSAINLSVPLALARKLSEFFPSFVPSAEFHVKTWGFGVF